PDEPEGHGIPPETMAGAPDGSPPHPSFLTLTNHFYSKAAPWPNGDQVYPAYIAKSDVVGFDLYPLQGWCRRTAFPDVFDSQREIVKLAAGKPTFQWIETAGMENCPNGPTAPTPESVKVESWLAIAGGAHGLGFFPS